MLAGYGHDLTKITSGICPSAANWQSDLIQLEHRTPGVGVENAITPCRLSACSMPSSVEATLVGGLLRLVLPISNRPRVTSRRARKIGLCEPGEHTSGPNLAARDNVAHNQTLYTILETPPPVIPLCRKQAPSFCETATGNARRQQCGSLFFRGAWSVAGG